MIPGLHSGAAAVLAAAVALRFSGRVAHRPRLARFCGRVVRLGLPVFLVIAGALGGWSYQRLVLAEGQTLAALPRPAKGAPNVLLVVLDTVRADHLGLYGYARPTSPNLDRLATRGVVFDEARSAAPWTLPSHASLFTGRWPHELGVSVKRPLHEDFPTIAGYLSDHGYATAGFVGNTYFCNSWFGLANGFAHYEDYYEANVLVSPLEALRCSALGRFLVGLIGPSYNARHGSANFLKDAERLNADFLAWQSAHPGRPFFAFLNYVDGHDPYIPRARLRGPIRPEGRDARGLGPPPPLGRPAPLGHHAEAEGIAPGLLRRLPRLPG